jgi:hypothetical protein
MATVLLLASGCGLSDYEKRMEEDQARAQRVEEENAMLTDPAEVPSDVDVFFRLPRGVNRTPKKEVIDGVLHVYDGPATVSSPFLDVDLAWSKDPKEDLQGKVWNALKVAKQPTSKEKVEKQGHKPIAVEKASFLSPKEDYAVYVYFHEEGGYKVAVVFKVDRRNDDKDKQRAETARSMMDCSMIWLGVDKTARQRKAAFKASAPEKK